jgi:S1-C subfamily serine protease
MGSKLEKLERVILFVITLVICQNYTARGDTLSDTYGQVHKSLALIVNETGKDSGTGFVVATSANSSSILTAAHVIGTSKSVLVFLNDDLSTQYRASIAKIDKTLDLALLTIRKGNLPVLDVATESTEGTAIAVAGYPRASMVLLDTTQELKPSVHEGVISSIRLGGRIIEHSAVTDFGNSGGPVFESDSGYVIGVVLGMVKNASGSYIATGYKTIQEFLSSANIKSAADYASAATLPNVPGAYRVVLVHGRLEDSPDQVQMRAAIDSRVIARLQAVLPGATFDLTTDTIDSPESVQSACNSHNAIGVVHLSESWAWAWPNVFVLPKVSTGLEIWMTDCWQDIIFNSQKSKSVNSGGADSTTAILSSMDDLTDQVVKELAAQTAVEPTSLVNLMRFGYYMPDGKKRVFFSLSPSATAAVVSYAAPFGTAARAGIQKGMVVLQVDGQSTVSQSQDDLTRMIENADDSGPVSVVVLNPDGTSATIKFKAQDIRWYLSHPLTS